MNILIRNIEILSMKKDETLFKGNICIQDDTIVAMGAVPETFIPDEIIDGEGKLAMPGMINAHTHISMSLFRNFADDLPFWPWLTEKIWPAEAKLRAEDAYYGAMVSIAEMISFGVTTFADMYFFMDDVARAVKETGIRASLSRGLVGVAGDANEKLEEAIQLHKDWHNYDNERIKVDMGPHAPYTCGPEYLQDVLGVAKKLDANIHIHLSETKKEVEDSYAERGKSPIQHVADLGLFDVKAMAAHCVHVSDEDIAILAKKNVSVISNPTSNLKLGNGAAPVQKMIEAGINVALGCDGSSSNNNLNMFEELNLAALLAKGLSGDTTSVPAITALEMATINGAKALGIDHLVGSLEVGKKADIILLDITKPHYCPRYDMISTLAYSAQASDVETVLVNGRILMRDRKLTCMNFAEIAEKAQACSEFLTKSE